MALPDIAIGDLLSRAPVLDGHNDLPWELRVKAGYDLDVLDIGAHSPSTQTDLPRLRAGGVGAQFWSVYVPSTMADGDAVRATLEQVDCVRRMTDRYAGQLALATSAEDVERAWASGRIASLMGAEGGQSIGCSMPALRMLHALGVRYLTLTHNDHTPWSDSATDERPGVGGLSAFGREVVREMNRLGMLVDLSHVATSTMHAALETSEAPVVFSHSSARTVCDHVRNVPDDVLLRLRDNGGVCMVTFVPTFVSPAVKALADELVDQARAAGEPDPITAAYERFSRRVAAGETLPEATVADVVAHIEHIRDVAGVAHIGIGGDYDGVERQPAGLEDVSCYPRLLAALAERGWSSEDLALLTSGNALRVLGEAQERARQLRTERTPSVARIEDLDGPR